MFASHSAALIDLLGNRPAFDWTFLASWIHHGALPTPGTPFVGVRQVRPGALLWIDDSGQSERFYWNPFRVASEPDDLPCSGQMRETFEACVTVWTHEARRVLVDLSGGLDSSAVAWAGRDHPAAVAAYLDCGTMACADEYGLPCSPNASSPGRRRGTIRGCTSSDCGATFRRRKNSSSTGTPRPRELSTPRQRSTI